MNKVTTESIGNFCKATSILDYLAINYWLDQGTLLGCIRENRLLPWDHDIDFGVWNNETNKNIILEEFIKAGFKREDIPAEMNCLHFICDDEKKVDITFYELEGDFVTTRWVAPIKNFKSRLIRNILEGLDPNTFQSTYSKRGRLTELIFRFMKPMFLVLPKKFRIKLVHKIEPLKALYPDMEIVKFSVPFDIFSNFKTIEFLGVTVKIPEYPENYLAYVYGPDWKIPKKNFDWRNDCSGLESI
jgi:phosphorylcholine metabolism protein LicD